VAAGSVFEIIQVLVLCATIGCFVSWVIALKKEQVAIRLEVEQLKRIVMERAEKDAAEKKAAPSGKSTSDATGTHSKLYMVGNVV
jgi:regulator of replication initiation timing